MIGPTIMDMMCYHAMYFAYTTNCQCSFMPLTKVGWFSKLFCTFIFQRWLKSAEPSDRTDKINDLKQEFKKETQKTETKKHLSEKSCLFIQKNLTSEAKNYKIMQTFISLFIILVFLFGFHGAIFIIAALNVILLHQKLDKHLRASFT